MSIMCLLVWMIVQAAAAAVHAGPMADGRSFGREGDPYYAQNLPGQQAQGAQKDFSLKIDVNLVAVDAIVRNKQGSVVGDLRAEDFAIFDNGIPQQITHLSRDQLPLAVALLIDCSPSIRSYSGELRDAAVIALQRVRPGDQVVLFSFAQCPYRLSNLTEDRSEIIEKIAGLKIMDMGTNLYDSIFEAARYLREHASGRRHAIILISDDYSDTSHYSEKETLQELLAASVTLINIRAPGFGSVPKTLADLIAAKKGAPFNFAFPETIERLAGGTGGEVLKLAGAGKLAGALETAISNLRLQYTIVFSPSLEGNAGNYHRIEVRLNPAKICPGCRVQARQGYYKDMPLPAARDDATLSGTKPYDCEDLRVQLDELNIKRIASDPRETNDIPFKVVTAKATDIQGEPFIRVLLQIQPQKISFRTADGLLRNKLRIAIIYADAKGKGLGSQWQTLDLNISESDSRQFLVTPIPFATVIPQLVSRQVLKIVVYDPLTRKAGSKFIVVK